MSHFSEKSSNAQNIIDSVTESNITVATDSRSLASIEFDTQINTAKAYPRDVQKAFHKSIDLATMNSKIAASCCYSLKRGGRDIKGPSIRLAEIVASCWGNFRASTRIVENDGKFVTAEAVAWDLESNVGISAQVKRSITDRNGRMFNSDMIVVTSNAACSIALRNAIFHVIPRGFIDAVYDEALEAATVQKKDIFTARIKAIKYMNSIGVPTDKILRFFKKSDVSELTAEHITELRQICTSIKDEGISVDMAFGFSSGYADEVIDDSGASKQTPEQSIQRQQNAAESRIMELINSR